MFSADSTCFPFVVNTWAGAITEADLSARIAWQHEIRGRAADWVTLSDLRVLERPDGAMRKRIADVMKQLDVLPGSQMRATAVVFKSPLIAGALRAVRWVAPQQKPEAYLTGPEDALRWLQRTAREVGITVPPEASDLAARLAAAGWQG